MEEKGRPTPAPADVATPPPAETLAEGPRRRGGAPKRKAAASASASPAPSKRLAKERSAIPQYFLPPAHNGPCTRARQSPNKLNAAAAAPQKPPEPAPGLAAAGGGGKGGFLSGKVVEAEEEEPAEEPVVDVEFDAIRTRGTGVHVAPTHAGWFSWNKIHPIEKHILASFFNQKSEKRTPDIYLEIRNFIMKKFHADPQTQVELKDLSELTVGDTDARQEVLEFLDHWGLINFHPFPPINPDPSVPDANDTDKESSLIEKLYQFEMVQSGPRLVHMKPSTAAPVLPNFLPEPIVADVLLKSEGPSVEYHCNSCSADCSRKRYHCQKQADFDLCTECYGNGKFGSGMAATDFILMEPAEIPGASGGSWTDQETLLLLEALELFGENWNEITEHVATKTKAQCILHFLQMPIEDPFLEGVDDVDDSSKKQEDDVHDNIVENPDPTKANKESADVLIPEKKEIVHEGDKENMGNKDQAVSSPMDALKRSDDLEVSHETGANIAIDILKSAFQLVGCLPEQGELLSFAEAGNPVMALAAFLAGLVGPEAAVTSTRSSLKAILEDSPSIQLATKHCFLFEDPPNDKKDLAASESAAANMDSGEGHKEQESISEGTNESKDFINKNEENADHIEMEKVVSIPLQECSQKQSPPKEAEDVVATTSTAKETGIPVVADQQLTSNTESCMDNLALSEIPPLDTKDPADSALAKEVIPSTVKEVKEVDLAKGEQPNSAEAGDVVKLDVLQQGPDTSKALNDTSNLAPLDVRDSQAIPETGSMAEDKEKTAEDDRSISPCNGEKDCDATEIDEDHNIERVKRAALTALSAAAVKAKLLAKEEEDQILQLVSLVIEKQLYKLETKLSIITEMESVVMRIKEHTDKARQRLYHERAQIIAARLGLPASSARANPSSIPLNKIAMNYSTSSVRPPYMAPEKSPPTRRS